MFLKLKGNELKIEAPKKKTTVCKIHFDSYGSFAVSHALVRPLVRLFASWDSSTCNETSSVNQSKTTVYLSM